MQTRVAPLSPACYLYCANRAATAQTDDALVGFAAGEIENVGQGQAVRPQTSPRCRDGAGPGSDASTDQLRGALRDAGCFGKPGGAEASGDLGEHGRLVDLPVDDLGETNKEPVTGAANQAHEQRADDADLGQRPGTETGSRRSRRGRRTNGESALDGTCVDWGAP